MGALILGAALLMSADVSGPTILGYPALAVVSFVLAAGGGVWMVWNILKPSAIFGAHQVMYRMHFEQVQMGQRCWISSVRRGTNIERPGPGSSLQILEDGSTAGHKTVLAWTQ
jgi:hypothetical protein